MVLLCTAPPACPPKDAPNPISPKEAPPVNGAAASPNPAPATAPTIPALCLSHEPNPYCSNSLYDKLSLVLIGFLLLILDISY